MRYTSTRDNSISASFEEAITRGYAPDGGLYVPCTLPFIHEDTVRSWAYLPFSELAYTVMRLFISDDEICDTDLREICDSALGNRFNDSNTNPIPIKYLGNVMPIAELFHGPTFCFKDFGLRCLIFFLSYFATKRKRKLTLLVSTTGDTGPAAVSAVKDAANPLLNILVHYPEGQISSFQRKQMTTVQSPNVRIASFQGGGDDMDEPIKQLLASCHTLGESLCGINSYNIGRPLSQMVHFIWIYLKVMNVAENGELATLDFILPTGAMGNLAGGYMAKKMGLPIGQLCASVNVNDITHRVIHTAQFHRSPTMIKTLSEAINIQVPYNFERLLFYLTDQNSKLLKLWMDQMEKTSRLDLDSYWHSMLCQQFRSARITDDEMCSAMKNIFEAYDYLVDPHTAVAIAGAEKLDYLDGRNKACNFVILATASPCKFEEAISFALGRDVWLKYLECQLPTQAKSVIMADEQDHFHYKNDGKNLRDVQIDWMDQVINIIKGFHG